MNNRDPIIHLPPLMKNGRYFNFRDICDRNLWDTGYLVKKLQGYGILRPPLMGPQFSIFDMYINHSRFQP